MEILHMYSVQKFFFATYVQVYYRTKFIKTILIFIREESWEIRNITKTSLRELFKYLYKSEGKYLKIFK